MREFLLFRANLITCFICPEAHRSPVQILRRSMPRSWMVCFISPHIWGKVPNLSSLNCAGNYRNYYKSSGLFLHVVNLFGAVCDLFSIWEVIKCILSQFVLFERHHFLNSILGIYIATFQFMWYLNVLQATSWTAFGQYEKWNQRCQKSQVTLMNVYCGSDEYFQLIKIFSYPTITI